MLNRLCGDPVVALYVGQNRLVFHVHLSLLCDQSPVFTAAFAGHFKESKERSMDLPDDDHDAVDRLVQWLYSRDYELPIGKTRETWNKCFEVLVSLNILADKYGIIELEKDIVKRFFQYVKDAPKLPAKRLVKHLYNNTSGRSDLRQMFVDWCCWHLAPSWFQMETSKAWLVENPEFATDVVSTMAHRLENPTKPNPFEGDGSYYLESLNSRGLEDRQSRSAKKARLA